MTEAIDYTNVGAIPTLDAETAVLGEPTSKTKSKTNVGKAAVLGLVLVGFLFIISGLLFYQKHKRSTVAAVPAKSVLSKPEFAAKNEAIESASIETTKAEIKKKQDESQAQIKAIEDSQAQAKALADLQAQSEVPKGPKSAPGQPYDTKSGSLQGNQGQNTAPGNQSTNQTPPPPPPPTPAQRKLLSGVLLDSGGNKPKGDTISEKEQQQREIQSRLAAAGVAQSSGQGQSLFGGQSSTQGSGQAAAADGIGARLQPTVLQARSAGKLPNLDFLLKRGTNIPCALKTGIDTTLPGFVICKVLNNVYSANGKVLLVERGADIFGEQQSQLKQGQERTFVVWTRIDNTNGVYANIDSPATDQMGFNGVPGYVDTHFWQRFGGAIMLSIIKDFSQAYTQRVANRTNSGTVATQTSNTNQAAQDMATEVLRNSINIPPTLIVLPAVVINVMLARDVSFESVFSIAE